MIDATTLDEEIARLRRAARPLTDVPTAPGWNLAELSDVIDPKLPRRNAAVLVPFVRRDDALSMLFTRRTAHLRTHAGQISFPGGAIETTDADAVAAALRETFEETGIEPERVDPFGFLDGFETVSGYFVTPVTGFVRGDYHLNPDPSEVDEVFEVPLDFILAPERLKRVDFDWQGRQRTTYEFEWDGRRVWGATASIIRNLLKRLESV
ncbi:MAG: CoA pyrophosphatase [Rhodanobacteraceae bacterium]